jgi:hypothetical protein
VEVEVESFCRLDLPRVDKVKVKVYGGYIHRTSSDQCTAMTLSDVLEDVQCAAQRYLSSAFVSTSTPT